MKHDWLNLTQKETVLIAILVCVLSFPISLWERRIEFIEPKTSYNDSYVAVIYTGLLFETIKITENVTFEEGVAWYGSLERSKYMDPNTRTGGGPHHQLPFSTQVSREYLWNGIILNTLLLTMFSIILVKLTTRFGFWD